MIDLRRFPRCPTRLKAYFPGDEDVYEVVNISYKGCFVRGKKNISVRKMVFFEIEIPEIGVIPVYGLVVHHGTEKEPGLGIEILEIERQLLPVWNYYLKALLNIEEAKKVYQKYLETAKELQENSSEKD
ncbi:PilZ domain-containing protein [Thermodesulfobacterium sp. TA1]|uniref:PilZ domain-containing protein n=1 Tax=Thermodesulfobacterium sp. TA1 TaxID=2234087 RepID=UPI001232CE1B|nr:PilZ domain-containing protein [Thermodesulfobacterium sp. TA1]QER42415.1 PilZ domain-containing protein [Thermodesulfobacterium sp. TA1]